MYLIRVNANFTPNSVYGDVNTGIHHVDNRWPLHTGNIIHIVRYRPALDYRQLTLVRHSPADIPFPKREVVAKPPRVDGEVASRGDGRDMSL